MLPPGHPVTGTAPNKALRAMSSAPKKRAAPQRSRPSFLLKLTLFEVEPDAEAEETTHDVRACPRRVESVEAVCRRRIKLRIDVKHIQDISKQLNLIGPLVLDGQVSIPLRTGLAIYR